MSHNKRTGRYTHSQEPPRYIHKLGTLTDAQTYDLGQRASAAMHAELLDYYGEDRVFTPQEVQHYAWVTREKQQAEMDLTGWHLLNAQEAAKCPSVEKQLYAISQLTTHSSALRERLKSVGTPDALQLLELMDDKRLANGFPVCLHGMKSAIPGYTIEVRVSGFAESPRDMPYAILEAMKGLFELPPVLSPKDVLMILSINRLTQMQAEAIDCLRKWRITAGLSEPVVICPS